MLDPVTAWVGGVVITGLVTLLGYLGRSRIERQEKEVEEERKNRAAEIDKVKKEFAETLERERSENKNDRHSIRNEINNVGAKISQVELTVARECINAGHLTAAIEPVMRRLGEIRSDMKEIYDRLDRKQDKPVGAD